jgi:SAM-dependent methyltransferase
MEKPIGGQGFGSVAGTYDRIRPAYPTEAITWALGDITQMLAPFDVVDVGAGTGKLTQQLVELGRQVRQVHAVEPDAKMLAVLTAKLPTVIGHIGTGEALPLPDASVDVITVAQAFHWMDEARSFAEFARVLRPGGRVILIWNDRDATRSRWNNELTNMLQVLGGNTTAHRMTGAPTFVPGFAGFAATDQHRIDWSQPITRQGLEDLVRSRSYVIALSADQRETFVKKVRVLMDTHPDLAGRLEFELPYVTSTFRFTKLT